MGLTQEKTAFTNPVTLSLYVETTLTKLKLNCFEWKKE